MRRLVLAIIGTLMLLSSAQAFAQQALHLMFSSEMVDQNGVSVSGMLPLQFKIYTSAKSRKPVWSGKQYVSIVDGKYEVSIGDASVAKLNPNDLYVGVELNGKEIARTRLSEGNARKIRVFPVKLGQVTYTSFVKLGDAAQMMCDPGLVMVGMDWKKDKDGQYLARLACAPVQ